VTLYHILKVTTDVTDASGNPADLRYLGQQEDHSPEEAAQAFVERVDGVGGDYVAVADRSWAVVDVTATNIVKVTAKRKK
jgi:hypothetical protein